MAFTMAQAFAHRPVLKSRTASEAPHPIAALHLFSFFLIYEQVRKLLHSARKRKHTKIRSIIKETWQSTIVDFELSFSVMFVKVKNNNTFLTLDFLVANQNKRVENSMMHLAHQNKNTQFRRKKPQFKKRITVHFS